MAFYQILNKGAIVDKNDFEKLKDKYYTLRGWDLETGFQTLNKLKELEMENIAQDLDKLGLLR